jgi:hypothetical protein
MAWVASTPLHDANVDARAVWMQYRLYDAPTDAGYPAGSRKPSPREAAEYKAAKGPVAGLPLPAGSLEDVTGGASTTVGRAVPKVERLLCAGTTAAGSSTCHTRLPCRTTRVDKRRRHEVAHIPKEAL